MVFMKSGSITGVLCPSLNDYSRALNVLRAWRPDSCALPEQRVYAGQKFEIGRSC